MEVLRREVGRLTAENSRLHADLLREADARAALEAEAYQRGKAAEAAAAELQYARTAALERASALERERDGLKAKVRELLCIGQHHGGGGCWEGWAEADLRQHMPCRSHARHSQHFLACAVPLAHLRSPTWRSC